MAIQNNNNKKKGKNNKGGPMDNPRNTERFFLKMVRDIAFGNIDMKSIEWYFRDTDFLDSAIKATYDKIMTIHVHLSAIIYCMQANVLQDNPFTPEVYNNDQRSYEAYNIIYNTLNVIKTTGDTGYLLALANKLPLYRQNM